MTLHSLDHFHEFSRHRGAEGEMPGERDSIGGLAFLLLAAPAAIGAISLLSYLG